ncbi:MAG TPA: 4Fe-4S dicluster domain-containing protein [Spirochaetota bacterium]|nr:4Fe-4S dicluster domain-containing protein [Spirochaetota bacterium]HPJ35677.1 4Fe-4S dicluster domain-containing protein [Spirochaetota bacterium]
MYLIEKSNVMKLAEELAKSYELYGPVTDKETGQVFFSRVDNASEISLSAELPALPPKSVVFPQIERIMKYKYDRDAKKAEIEADYDKSSKAIFGMRPCDLTGLIVLDRFFLGQEFVDEVYREHRKRMFIVSNTCVVPFKQCFCVCTDSGPAADEGYDLNLTEIGDMYLVEAGSEKGKALAEKLGLKAAGDEYVALKKEVVDKSISLFEKVATDNKAWISRVMNRVTTGFIKEEVWEYIGKQCFECGACTFVCPTCSCFNVEDHNRFDGSTDRLRTWDSCSFEGYTKMAGDHNPRHPVEDRRNKRFFCKLSYSQSKKYLRPGCVGCGRCQWVCPGDIGLPNVVTYIRREITE